jgi:predicted metal-dependent phosphoesterase TrpH
MLAEGVVCKKFIDLHIHSKYSDGTCTIQEIVECASSKGLAAIAITDHDCIDGYTSAAEIGSRLGIEVIPAVELSSEIEGKDIHILGYGLDIHNAHLQASLAEMKEARYIRAKKIVKNLNARGIDLRFETVAAIAGDASIGRPHIATALLKEELIYSFRDAFERYIGYDSPAYVGKKSLTPKEVFDLILSAGGIPTLAHPGVTRVDERIPSFVTMGLMGIEVYHSEHTATQQRFYLQYCKRNGLVYTGGSDFHSSLQTKAEIGIPHVPYRVIEILKEKQTHLQNNRSIA